MYYSPFILLFFIISTVPPVLVSLHH